VNAALLAELWQACVAARWGLARQEFDRIVCEVATAVNFGLSDGEPASAQQQAEFFRGIRLDDLVLARACALGYERAWAHFVTEYRQPLLRAAIAITSSESLGRELADQLYGELYGLTSREGERRCPLASYRGRGSLMGWLRTTLAQRHVDHHRRTQREDPLEDMDAAIAEEETATPDTTELSALERAVGNAVGACDAEERYLLAAYFLDGRRLAEIARVLGVHEATASRKLHRTLDEVRKSVLHSLEMQGLSRRAAQELLDTDPRDLNMNLRKLLQQTQVDSFPEKAPLEKADE
jgi:RNA polymerase sigma-70 factor (ECF subfamily)